MAIQGIKVRLKETAEGGFLILQVNKEDRGIMKKWVVGELARSAKPRVYEMELKVHRKRRSLEQNALYWALVTILAFEAYQEFGYEEEMHEELLNMYAPKIEAKLGGRSVPKRSSKMNTVEFSGLIEGVFREIAMLGVSVENGVDIERYWQEWMRWRGTQGVDPLTESYQNRKDWMDRQVFCETCTTYLGPGRGTAAHIVSRGSGGSDEIVNLLRLCDTCHMSIQHQQGWDELIERFPHIEARVKAAYAAHGAESPREEAQNSAADTIPVFDQSASSTPSDLALREDEGVVSDPFSDIPLF